MGGPLRFILTGGQESDIGQAANLLAGLHAGALLADKGYDADALLNTLRENQMEAVIPPKANRIVQRPYDEDLYKERSLDRVLLRQDETLPSNLFSLREIGKELLEHAVFRRHPHVAALNVNTT